MTATVSGFGLSMTVPTGWEAVIYRRPSSPGETTHPVAQAATVAIPSQRGDYGGGIVETLGSTDVFVAFLEFGPQAAGSALFPTTDVVPAVTAESYRPRQLQRTVQGQAGVQRFFTIVGRSFCLYSVIGSVSARVALASAANQLIGSFQVEPLP